MKMFLPEHSTQLLRFMPPLTETFGYPVEDCMSVRGAYLLHAVPVVKQFEDQYRFADNLKDRFDAWMQTYLRYTRFFEWLQSQAHEPILEVPNEWRGLVNICAAKPIFSGCFDSVFCPVCSTSYKPEEGKVEEWSVGGGLCGSWGRRWVCRNGHTLYSFEEMHS